MGGTACTTHPITNKFPDRCKLNINPKDIKKVKSPLAARLTWNHQA